MSSEWSSTTTAQLIAHGLLKIGDGYRAKNNELGDDGLPFVRAADIDGGINLDGVELLTSASVAKAGDKISQVGDTVFTSKGTVGRFAFVKRPEQRFVYSPQLCFWRSLDAESLDPRFLHYWLRGPEAWQQFSYLKGQTDMADFVSLGDQRAMSVRLPAIDEQRRIAAVLSILDDKIEHNRSLSERVIATALELFGSMRSGWNEDGVLGEIASSHRMFSKGDDAGLPYIGLDAMPQGSPILSQWGTASGKGQVVRFERGDILFGKLRPYFKKIGVAPIDGCGSTEILVLRPNEEELWGVLLGYALSDAFIAHAIARSTGTKMPRSEWKELAEFPIGIPDHESAAMTTAVMRPLFERVTAATHESRRLSQLLDTLLPKLISGELRVPDSYDPDEVLGPVLENETVAA